MLLGRLLPAHLSTRAGEPALLPFLHQLARHSIQDGVVIRMAEEGNGVPVFATTLGFLGENDAVNGGA